MVKTPAGIGGITLDHHIAAKDLFESAFDGFGYGGETFVAVFLVEAVVEDQAQAAGVKLHRQAVFGFQLLGGEAVA